jgi:hypothetical protein
LLYLFTELSAHLRLKIDVPLILESTKKSPQEATQLFFNKFSARYQVSFNSMMSKGVAERKHFGIREEGRRWQLDL